MEKLGFVMFVLAVVILAVISFGLFSSYFFNQANPNEIPCTPIEPDIKCYKYKNGSDIAYELLSKKVNGKQLSSTFNRDRRHVDDRLDGKVIDYCEFTFYQGLSSSYYFITPTGQLDFSNEGCKHFFSEYDWALLKKFNQCRFSEGLDVSCKWMREYARS